MVYTGDAFWYHEWVEAYIQRGREGERERGRDKAGDPRPETGDASGSWVPLDASFPESRVDAAHIAIARVCGQEDLMKASAAVMGLLGKLKIEVLEAKP